MKHKIKITESQFKDIVKESIKISLLEKKKRKKVKNDFVRGMKRDEITDGFGGKQNMLIYTLAKDANINPEEFQKRIDSDNKKVTDRKERKLTPHKTPEERINEPGMRDKVRAGKKSNQLLLPFGDEEKASNRSKEKSNKTKKK